MPGSKKLMISIALIILATAAAALLMMGKTSALQKLPAHPLKTAETPVNNPLKGFMPYSYSDTDFPHSLEWFYIPMSFLYPDPDSSPETKPDWTSLEKELDNVAKRGHQAVFRIVLDYPSDNEDEHPFSLPKFLLNEKYGLETYSYTEYGNTISKIPDYSNLHLRNTIKNCIAALGEKYDGDGRIGFITGGFLGFWGEWHCWPYDSGIGDGLPDYEPSGEVFDEVINAYEQSFEKTKILFRTPKASSTRKSQFGFHDDSYCYSTIPADKGGNSWNFAELLRNAEPGCENRWKTAPIGGELRPEIQAAIFENDEPWESRRLAPGENWTDNLKTVHPSWMLNQSIADYTGRTRENAIKAGKQMGYDLRITTAYFADKLSRSNGLKLAVDIINAGVAPFYYDHTMWPVKIGIMQKGKLVSDWNTNWDLNRIAADGKPTTFSTEAPENIRPKPGSYTICIKVINPLPNGINLSFSNTGQRKDGWLELGSFTIKK